MIDWLTVVVPIRAAIDFKSGEVSSCDAYGEREWVVSKRLPVRGSHDRTVSVRRSRGCAIEFSGSPAKFLQGHNAFGSDDLIGVGAAMILKACRVADIELLEDEISDICAGRYEILRVDINFSFAMGTRSTLLDWINKAAAVGNLERRGRGQMHGSSTVNWGEKSRHWTLKAYAKGDELSVRRHVLPANLPKQQDLLDWCADKLRVELSLKARQLKKLGLDQALAWSEETAHQQFRAHLSQLSLHEGLTPTPAHVEALPSHLRLTHRLWQLGDDLSVQMKRSKLYRHRKELLKRGFNISIPPGTVNGLTAMPLGKYLESPVDVPDWAKLAGLYFDPSGTKVERDVSGVCGVGNDKGECVNVEQRYGVTDICGSAPSLQRRGEISFRLPTSTRDHLPSRQHLSGAPETIADHLAQSRVA